MISNLLKDLNVDCNFTNDIKESKYVEEFEQLDVTDRYGIAYGQ